MAAWRRATRGPWLLAGSGARWAGAARPAGRQRVRPPVVVLVRASMSLARRTSRSRPGEHESRRAYGWMINGGDLLNRSDDVLLPLR